MRDAKILIVDDEPEMLENIDRLLTGEGRRCWQLSDPLRFRDIMSEVRPDVLITDLHMPGADGMTLLAAAQADDPSLPVILITGYATVSSAVRAIQEGAFDYVAKPFTADQLTVVVERALRFRALVVENQDLKERIGRGEDRGEIVGSSPGFVRILDQARRVAATAANVLITGESGTGKEVVARLIHGESPRVSEPFVPVDCAALPEGLLESELFGHEKGAFTGAVARTRGLVVEADGGTLFLDEVAELTPPLQAKLLRVLEQRQLRPVGGTRLVDVDIRVVAATNADLDEAVRRGDFREDLFYRLNVVHLRLPPLRARQQDIALLVDRFLSEFAARSGKAPPEITGDVWELLEGYEWPGNIRQLRNLVERVVALDHDGKVTVSDLPPEIRFASLGAAARPGAGGFATFDYEAAREEAMRQFRASYLSHLLDAHGGNVSRAARTAGVSRRTLHRWLAELNGSHADARSGDDD